MKYSPLIWILLLLLGSCKPDIPNKEPYFTLYFKAKDSIRNTQELYPNITGISENGITKQIFRTDTSIYLPLNLNANAVKFYFRNDSLMDTLYLNYKIITEARNHQFYAIPTNISVTGSFDSLIVECEKINLKECMHAESATVIY